MSDLVVATICTRDRLPAARVLAASLAEHHPGLPFAGVLVDGPAPAPFATLLAADLEDERAPRELMARCSTLKPRLLEHLLEAGHGSALYLDPDQLLLAPVPDLLARVRAHSLVLTPHLTRPALRRARAARARRRHLQRRAGGRL